MFKSAPLPVFNFNGIPTETDWTRRIHRRAEQICAYEIGYQNKNTMVEPLRRATSEAIQALWNAAGSGSNAARN